MAYDVYGNVTNNGSVAFQYDDASNMRCVNCALSSKVKYDYDANRMRVKKLVGSTATYFLHGLNGSLLGEYTPASQLQKEYFYLGSKLLAEREKTSLPTPTITYYHDDIVGSPIGATDKTGALAWREHYWPYGERNIRDSKAAKDTRWFAGKSQDAESRLSYFGARYYDPLLGRFMGIDPVGVDESNVHSHNRYAYGNNNPYKYVDPDGNSPIDIAFLAVDIGRLGVAAYNGEALGGAAIDVAISAASVFSPVPGVGEAYKVGRAAEKAVDAAKAVNGNSKLSQKSQVLYEIFHVAEDGTETVIKTGVSSGKLTANGQEAYRARAQLGKIKEAYGENVQTRIVDRVEAGAGARGKVLELERANAAKYGDALDKRFHKRP